MPFLFTHPCFEGPCRCDSRRIGPHDPLVPDHHISVSNYAIRLTTTHSAGNNDYDSLIRSEMYHANGVTVFGAVIYQD